MAKKPDPESVAAIARQLEAQLHAEGLGAAEFEYTQARKQVFDDTKHKHFHPRAQQLLEDHTWPDTPAGRLDRACWELHVQRKSNRAIAAELKHLGAYRVQVDKIIARLKRLADGRISRRRAPGRPADTRFGRGARGVLRVSVRFNEAEATALYRAEDKLRSAGIIPPVARKRVKVRGVTTEVLDRALAVVIRAAVALLDRSL